MTGRHAYPKVRAVIKMVLRMYSMTIYMIYICCISVLLGKSGSSCSVGNSQPLKHSSDNRLCDPSNCNYRVTESGITATCTDGDVRHTLSSLPSDISELDYTINQPFDDHNVDFTRLSSLTSLRLTAPPLTSYDVPRSQILGSKIFNGLHRLKRLQIHLNLDWLNPDALTVLPSLTDLDLSHTRNLNGEKVSSILSAIANASIPLRKLNLTNVRFPLSRDIPLNVRLQVLRPLDGVPLEELDISDNGLVTLHSGYSRYLPTLKRFRWRSHIVVMDNYEDSWACSVLDFLVHPNITYVDMGNDGPPQQISGILESERRRVRNVQRQSPSGELLCDMVQKMCPHMQETVPCDIFPIDLLDPGCFAGVVIPIRSMETVSYSHSDFTMHRSLDGLLNGDVAFCITPNNNFRYMDFSFNNFGDSAMMLAMRGYSNMQYLNLQGDKLTVVDFEVFWPLPKLEVLLLSGNNLNLRDDSESRLFRIHSQLRVLDLEDTGTTCLSFQQFEHLINLNFLNLSRNSLISFDVNITGLKQLHYLNLSYNRLNFLPGHVTSHLDQLANVTLDISENGYLSCQCIDIDFVRWLHQSTIHFANKGSTLCSHPYLGTTSPWNIDLSGLVSHCHPSYTHVIVISVSTSVSVLALAGSAYLIYRRRWMIRLYFYTARNAWRKEQVGPSSKRTFRYDAFVVYNADDRQWVHGTLRPILEDDRGLRLCLHYRDFIPGRFVVDTIVESIDKSRKTILVLSPNFLKSDWCYFEYQMARQTLITEGRDVLILVKIGDLPTSKLSRTMARLLQEKTYLEWTRHSEGQTLFWTQLLKAIREENETDER